MSLVARDQVPLDRTWDLAAVYSSEAAWEEELGDLPQLLEELSALRGRLGEGRETLREALGLVERIWRSAGRLLTYASGRHDEDTADPRYQSMVDRLRSTLGEVMAAQSFLRPEVLSLPEEAVREWLAEDPELATWTRWLEELWREAPHLLSPAEERILAALGEAAGAPGLIRGRLTAADLDYGTIEEADGSEVPLTSGTYGRFMRSPDREVRRTAFERYMDGHKAVRNSLAASYQTHARLSSRAARLRGFDSARARALHGPEIPESVYDLLVDTVRANLPLLHRYYALRRRALGLERLQGVQRAFAVPAARFQGQAGALRGRQGQQTENRLAVDPRDPLHDGDLGLEGVRQVHELRRRPGVQAQAIRDLDLALVHEGSPAPALPAGGVRTSEATWIA